MSCTTDVEVGDIRERVLKIGWFGRDFCRNGRTFRIRRERVWVREQYTASWDDSFWLVLDWSILPRERGAQMERDAVAAHERKLRGV